MTIRDDDKSATAALDSPPPTTEEQDPRRFMPPVDAHIVDGNGDIALPSDEASPLKPKWSSLQLKFVDDPRQAVQEADGLVTAAIQRLVESFARERAELQAQWARGGDVSTEDLRLAFRRYRSFFDRLPAA